MKKIVKSIVAVGMCAMTLLASTTAFAATYTNSIGSKAEDISVIDDSGYTVAGQDITQRKKSEYTTVSVDDTKIESPVNVYATVAEGSDVYDPENPDANDDGWVDGDILVGVPTTLIMSGTPDEDGYYIAEGKGKVKGNIAGTTIINVVPDNTVTLSSEGKDDITADITQNYTKFTVPTSTVSGSDVNKNVTASFNADATFIVDVKTNQATAGSWNGSFNYEISLSTAA